MPETTSKFDKLVEDAAENAAGKIEDYFVRQGVPRPRAIAFMEREVTALRMPGLDIKLRLKCGEIMSRGASDACLVWFARQLHVQYKDELGGEPQYIRNEEPPEPDDVIERRERIQAERKKGDTLGQKIAADREESEKSRALDRFFVHKTLIRSMI